MPREDLDSFLQEHYGYGVWEFEFSILNIYTIYFEKNRLKLNKFIEKRIEELYSLKEKVAEILNDYLLSVKFFNREKFDNTIEEDTKIDKWTTDNIRKFIIKSFRLEPFIFTIDNLIRLYDWQIRPSPYEEISFLGFFPPNIKPLNLIILHWSNALKRGEKKDWINMEQLLLWFNKRMKEYELIDLYDFAFENIPPPETLRLIWNKYKKNPYNLLATWNFDLFFNLKKNEIKKRSPHPFEEFENLINENFWLVDFLTDYFDHDTISVWVNLYSGYGKLKDKKCFERHDDD